MGTDFIALAAPMLIAVGLMSVRLGMFVISAPVLSTAAFPARFKVALVVLIAFCALGGMPNPVVVDVELWAVAKAVAAEAVVGAAAGTCARVIFAGVESAGAVLGVPMGLGFAQSVDPLTNNNSVVTANLLSVLISMVFFALDVHVLLLRHVIASFHAFPPGEVVHTPGVGLHLAQLGSRMFSAALQLAAPVLVVLLGVMVSLGILARIAPKVNLFALSFAISIGVGLVALYTAMPNIVAYARQMVLRMGPFVENVLQAFAVR